MVGVQVGDEDRPQQRTVRGEPLVDGEPGPPQLAVHTLAGVDEVDGVADDDRVGGPAPPRLGIGAPAGSEQDEASGRVRVPRSAAVSNGGHG